MKSPIAISAAHISLWLGVGRSKAYQMLAELKVYCGKGPGYIPTVWDFCAWQQWKQEYIFYNLYFTKEDIIKHLVNEILPKQLVVDSKYFGVQEIPFP